MISKLLMILLSRIRDEDSRRRLFVVLLAPLIVVILVLTMLAYILASSVESLSMYLDSEEEYSIVRSFKSENDSLVEDYLDLSFSGIYPLPFDYDGDVRITDDYGYRIHPITGEYRMHWGIDFATVHHCEIKSIADGVVTFADVYGTYGNTVIIKHETLSETFYSLYAHLSEIEVYEGEVVEQGDVIGLEGGSNDDPNYGASTGHHLHFGIMDESRGYVDPKLWQFYKKR